MQTTGRAGGGTTTIAGTASTPMPLKAQSQTTLGRAAPGRPAEDVHWRRQQQHSTTPADGGALRQRGTGTGRRSRGICRQRLHQPDHQRPRCSPNHMRGGRLGGGHVASRAAGIIAAEKAARPGI